ncbi:hypothetical protein [Salinimonas chungwhensis]|uniref:hypothetical protein n=1 Tax=Salinimonas chungwhensis TaxID=265425 RepID=UPI0012E9C2E9|nr:hypothetical protein [Salinimonas chungwhensis]
MRKFVCGIGLLLLLFGCSGRPTFEEMQTHFEENRATFSMIAALACDSGEESGADEIAITSDSSVNQTLLALADTMNIENIIYRQADGRCALTMRIYEDEYATGYEQFAYRYNVPDPAPYNPITHNYDTAVEKIEQGAIDEIDFDMKLAKRWYFSFSYKDIG